MSRHRSTVIFAAGLAAVFAFLLSQPKVFAASKEKILHRFLANDKDGIYPWFQARLIFDAAGNLYGTTTSGGHYGYGTVFRLAPGAKGKWTERVLYSFQGGTDGVAPEAGLILDAAGNLYGTTWENGAYGYGTVFELIAGADDTWSEKILYSFANGTDGGNPAAPVIFDASGNLYGTVSAGVNAGCDGNGCGGVFKLTPGSNGTWTETVLCSFIGNSAGGGPEAGVIFDASGNLYGTTESGGNLRYCFGNGCGVVFELTPESGGKWTETVLHSFNGKDGSYPAAPVLFDSAGNLYGTTTSGGVSGYCTGSSCGTVFKLTPGKNGKWAETLLYKFKGNDGADPWAGLVFDAKGALYGTTTNGGLHQCGYEGCGVVFKLTPAAGGKWTETVLHSFNGSDGPGPSGVILDSSGNLYGTTAEGSGGTGDVFELMP